MPEMSEKGPFWACSDLTCWNCLEDMGRLHFVKLEGDTSRLRLVLLQHTRVPFLPASPPFTGRLDGMYDSGRFGGLARPGAYDSFLMMNQLCHHFVGVCSYVCMSRRKRKRIGVDRSLAREAHHVPNGIPIHSIFIYRVAILNGLRF